MAERRGAHHRRHRRRRGALQRPRLAGVPAGRRPQVRILVGCTRTITTPFERRGAAPWDELAPGAPEGTSMVRHIPMPCRAALLADHEGDSLEEAAEPGTSDLASAPDYQTILDQVQALQHPCWRSSDQSSHVPHCNSRLQAACWLEALCLCRPHSLVRDDAQAVAHVAAIEADAEAAADYDRLTATSAAATAGDTAAKVRRSLELDKQPSQSLGMSSLKLEGSLELPPFVPPAHT